MCEASNDRAPRRCRRLPDDVVDDLQAVAWPARGTPRLKAPPEPGAFEAAAAGTRYRILKSA